VRDAVARRVDQAGDLLGAGARGSHHAHRPGADDVGEAQPDAREHRGAALRAHHQQPALRAAALERDLVVERDVVGEQEDVQAPGQRAIGLERRVLAGHRDQRDVAALRRGQRPRPLRVAIGGRAAAAGEESLDLGEDVVADAVLAVDGDHEVAGPCLGARAQRGERAEVGRRAHHNLARRDAVVAAQRPRDPHQPHAVGIAVGQREDLPAHAATGAGASREGPSESGTIHVPCWPRTAPARWPASVMTALPP
jgi:hypothetical protein